MKQVGDRGCIASGLGGSFDVVIESVWENGCRVRVDNRQSDFHGQILTVAYNDIRPPADLVPIEVVTRLRENWPIGDKKDLPPVLKLATANGRAVWLLTEIKDDLDIGFGLCDLGQGYPELGYVSLFELARLNLGVIAPVVSRDPWFFAEASLGVYARAARTASAITFHRDALRDAYRALLNEHREPDDPLPWVMPAVAQVE